MAALNVLGRVEYDHLWLVGIFQSLQCLNEKKKEEEEEEEEEEENASYCLNASMEEML